MQPEDNIIALANLQKEIKDYLGLNSNDLFFDYQQVGNLTKLDLITVNPRHSQSFLFHSTEGIDKLEALTKMMSYIKTTRHQEQTFTIQWVTISENEMHTSYFRAHNMYEALDKLYYGRDLSSITVYSCLLNPIS